MTVNTQINGTVEYLKSTVVLSSANIKAMYATPVLLIPAQGAHTIIAVHDVFLELVYVAPTYAPGDPNGSVFIQYGNTPHAAGPLASVVNSIVNNTASRTSVGLAQSIIASPATYINTGIYISNQSAAYITGNGTINCTLFYSIINTIA